jgi:hypothetical protein
MRSMLTRLAFLAAMLPMAALAQGTEWIPGSTVKIGLWEIRAWRDRDGRSACTMGIEYVNKVVMSFSLEGDQWRVYWRHPSWPFTLGQVVSVTYWVDDWPPRTVDAKGWDDGPQRVSLRAVLPDDAALFDQFRSGSVLRVRLPSGATYNLNLTATSAALVALRDCAAKYRGVEPPPPPNAPTSGQAGAILPELTADQRVEAVRLAANLLTKMPGFRILGDEDQKAMSVPVLAKLKAAVVWQSGGVFGIMHLFPSKTEADVPDLAAAMAFGSAKTCTGEFSLTIAPDVRSATVRRVHSSCVDDKDRIVARMIVMPFGKSGVYFFVTTGEGKDEAAVVRAEELLRNALFEVTKR